MKQILCLIGLEELAGTSSQEQGGEPWGQDFEGHIRTDRMDNQAIDGCLFGCLSIRERGYQINVRMIRL